MLGWLLLGALLGVGILTIAYVVSERITLSAIPRLIREALKTSSDEKASKLLGAYFKTHISEIEENTITFEQLVEGSDEKVSIKITGTGIDSGIRKGMELYC